MPSRYNTSEQSNRSRYAKSKRSSSKKKKKDRTDIGFISNLGKDVVSAVLGLPGGVKATIEHPIRTAEQIGESYKQTYGGGLENFREQFYEHPLGPLLDVATVATLGAGAGAKAGVLPSNTTKRAFSSGDLTVTQRTSRNPLTGRVQRASRYATTKTIPHETPVIGEHARTVRLAAKQKRRSEMAERERVVSPFRRAVGKLSSDEKKILPLLAERVSPSQMRSFVDERLSTAKANLAVAEGRAAKQRLLGEIKDHERMQKFLGGLSDKKFSNPSPKLLAAKAEADKLTDTGADLLESIGKLSAESRALRPYLAARVVGGARFDKATGEFVGGPSVDALRASLGDATYFPNIGPKMQEGAAPQRGSGSVPPREPGTTKQNKAIRFLASRYLPTPDAWTDSYVRALGYMHALSRGKLAASIAKDLNPDGSLSKGHYYINIDGEKISKAQRERAALEDQFDEFVQGNDDLSPFLEERYVSKSGERANDWREAGYRVGQISAADFRQIFGEFQPSSTFVRRFIDKPTDFWRALTLNLRPAWIVNNIIGQQLLYALHNADPKGVKAYATAVLGKSYLPEELRFGLFRSEATASGTIKQASNVAVRMTRAIGTFQAKISDEFPRRAAFRAAAERELALINKVDGTNKKLGTFLDELKKAAEDPTSSTPAVRQIHDDLVQEVLDQLIDFQNLSEVERRYVRRAIPFYSWMKGITKATLQLTLEHPDKALLVYLLGQTGVANLEKDFGPLPSYLQNLVPISEKGGELTAVATGGLNPLQSFTDVGNQLLGQTPDTPSPANALSPILQGLIEAASERDLFTGQNIGPEGGGARGLAERFINQSVRSFPQASLLEAILTPQEKRTSRGPRLTVPGSTVNIGGREIPVELLRYFGVPITKKNLSRAHQLAREQD